MFFSAVHVQPSVSAGWLGWAASCMRPWPVAASGGTACCRRSGAAAAARGDRPTNQALVCQEQSAGTEPCMHRIFSLDAASSRARTTPSGMDRLTPPPSLPLFSSRRLGSPSRPREPTGAARTAGLLPAPGRFSHGDASAGDRLTPPRDHSL